MLWARYFSVWLSATNPGDTFHKLVASLVTKQAELQAILSEHSHDRFLPITKARTCKSLCSSMLEEYSLLATEQTRDSKGAVAFQYPLQTLLAVPSRGACALSESSSWQCLCQEVITAPSCPQCLCAMWCLIASHHSRMLSGSHHSRCRLRTAAECCSVLDVVSNIFQVRAGLFGDSQ